MQLKDIMSSVVRLARPDQTIQDVARAMVLLDVGIMPITENDRLIGMITDRDIAVRAVAKGLPAHTPVRQIMTPAVIFCYERDELESVVEKMRDHRIRRLPVLNRKKRLAGIISLGDIAAHQQRDLAGAAICGISERGGLNSQTATADIASARRTLRL